MSELAENITLNNEDMSEILRWYEKSSRFYDNKVETARAELVNIVQDRVLQILIRRKSSSD